MEKFLTCIISQTVHYLNEGEEIVLALQDTLLEKLKSIVEDSQMPGEALSSSSPQADAFRKALVQLQSGVSALLGLLAGTDYHHIYIYHPTSV